jgi:hypothetical protein
MYFREIGRNRYRVYKNKNDDKFYGTIEKEEYVSIDMSTGKRVTKRLWKVHGRAGGWRTASKEHFATREAAGKFLLKDAAQPYNEKPTHWNTWTRNQGESEVLKETKAGA